MKRGGGRRYYRPEDLALLRGIRHLLHAEGYTIKGVQKILREQGAEQVKVMARAVSTPSSTASGRRMETSKTPMRKGQSVVSVSGQPKQSPQSRAPIAQVPAASTQVSVASTSETKASRDEVIRLVIRELELCRALLIGNVIAEANAGEKRSRAGGRT